MNVVAIALVVATLGVFALAGISFYLLKIISDLEKEVSELQPPF